jgi:hypothetical protein
MLRNIYLSNRYSTALNELRNTASSMGTSPSVIQDKYVKLDNNLEDNLLDDI